MYRLGVLRKNGRSYLYIIRSMKTFVTLKEKGKLVKYPMFLYFCPAAENRGTQITRQTNTGSKTFFGAMGERLKPAVC